MQLLYDNDADDPGQRARNRGGSFPSLRKNECRRPRRGHFRLLFQIRRAHGKYCTCDHHQSTIVVHKFYLS